MSAIGIDCRLASFPVGIGRYTLELVTHLLRIGSGHRYVLFVRSRDESWLSGLPADLHVADVPHYSLHEQFVLPSVIRHANIDLLFVPHFNVPYICPVPFVCTVHDLILHHYPNQASIVKRIAYKHLMGHAVRCARKVITVSNATKQDITQTYGRESTVVYPGISHAFKRTSASEQKRVREQYNVPARYLLYVGSAKEHKNVAMLIDAFTMLADVDLHLLLIVNGSEADDLHLPDRVMRLGRVRDQDLPSLYSASSGFVTASLYEGFGLPLLEAMACGCPVLAVRCGSMPEVYGPHAMFVDPTTAAVCVGMQALLSQVRSDEEVASAVGHARSFSWEKAAMQLGDIFSSLLQ